MSVLPFVIFSNFNLLWNPGLIDVTIDWDGLWVILFKKCVRHSGTATVLHSRWSLAQTWGQLLSNVIDYITITFQFSWLHYITITSIFKCNQLQCNDNQYINVLCYFFSCASVQYLFFLMYFLLRTMNYNSVLMWSLHVITYSIL